MRSPVEIRRSGVLSMGKYCLWYIKKDLFSKHSFLLTCRPVLVWYGRVGGVLMILCCTHTPPTCPYQTCTGLRVSAKLCCKKLVFLNVPQQ